MIDTIKTLKNLNKKFPRFQLNTLLDILDCIEEKPEITTIPWDVPTFTPSTITCTNDTSTIEPYNATASTEDNMLLEPKKHHMKDKTSKNVRILTEEVPADIDEEMNDDDIKSLYKETVGLFQDYLSKLDFNDILK